MSYDQEIKYSSLRHFGHTDYKLIEVIWIHAVRLLNFL